MITTEIQETEIFKALSEPIRLRIMALLATGELCVCDLTRVLQMPQSTISRHMSRLKVNGLVKDRRAGKWIHYSLDQEFSRTFPEFARFFESLRAKDPYRTDTEALKSYVASIGCDPE